MSRSIKIILTLLVITNLLMAGYVVGHLAKFADMRNGPSSPHDIVKNLPNPLASQIKKLIDQTLLKQRTLPSQLKREESLLIGILTAASFDESAFRRQLDALDRLHNERHRQMTELMTTIAGKLDQKQRLMLANYLLRASPKAR